MNEETIKKEEIVETRPLNTDRHGVSNEHTRKPVDIIIPFKGNYEKVTALLNSIVSYTIGHPYLITLVDDNSPNKRFADILNEPEKIIKGSRKLTIFVRGKETPLIRCIGNKGTPGFGGSVNFGIKNTEKPLVVVMHSDCTIKYQHWLSDLVDSLNRLKNFNVKMIAAKTDNPGEGYPDQLKISQTKDLLLKGDIISEKCYLPLYCVMFNRTLFKLIGGFKEYPYTWYEDLEYAVRMKVNNFKQGISGTSWVLHEGGATVKKLINSKPKIKNEIEENRKRCIQDVKEILKTIQNN